MRPRTERGSGTVLVAAMLVVALLVVGAVLVISGYLLVAHRARVAADLAALSGAAAVARGQDPCRAARAVSERSGVRVVRCSWVGDQTDYVVTVQVAVSVSTRIPGLPRSVSAAGNAGPVQLATASR